MVKLKPLKFGKKTRKKSKTSKKVVEKERDYIQPMVDEYLKLMKSIHHIEVIRIPDALYAIIKNNHTIPLGIKMQIIGALKSIPDNIVIKRGLEYNNCLCLELKTEGNDLSQGQRKFAKNVRVEVSKSFDNAKEKIDRFINAKN